MADLLRQRERERQHAEHERQFVRNEATAQEVVPAVQRRLRAISTRLAARQQMTTPQATRLLRQVAHLEEVVGITTEAES